MPTTADYLSPLKSGLEFRKRIAKLSREEILSIVERQNPELVEEVEHIEWAFANKLGHLTDDNGCSLADRRLTNAELALLVDEPFEEDPQLTAIGMDRNKQYEFHLVKDPVLFSRAFLNQEPRAYQIIPLREPNNRKVMRFGRRAGKTFTLAVLLIHYSFMNKSGRCLVMTPMKSQAELLYAEINNIIEASIEVVRNSRTRYVTAPQYVIDFSNGSKISFFTTGMKSGNKSDVARGQEAHIIVLDEMDYMGPEDIDAVYAMLQQTSKNQAEKLLIAASTPTGQRSRFWQWCTGRTNDGKLKRRFTEFYFPSYCNPLWTDEREEEMREYYAPNPYRREIEADWGESAEGVYPRKLVDAAFNYADWKYVADITSATTFYTIGVDWDKYGAGVNIVVMEVFPQGHSDQRFAGRMRVVYREEMPKEQFALLKAVDRVVELNTRFRPTHIYIDRGFGETQLELLHKYGMEHPQTRLHKIVKGWQFSETVEQLDPFTKQPTKKMIKPLMVDNLGTLLEKARILFPTHDEDLYQQLTAYILVKTSESGKPVFEMAGGLPDHAHDALLLAAFAVSHNYDDLFRLKYATSAKSFSNEILTNKQVTNSDNIDYPDEVPTPRSVTRAMTLGSKMRSGGVGGIKRKMF